MTQLLKGRNKKVSDEVIAKIHRAYPTLNVSWLMFGEGDMETCTDFQISEPEFTQKNDFENLLIFDSQPIAPPSDAVAPANTTESEKSFHNVNKEKRETNSIKQVESQNQTATSSPPTVAAQRRVVNILVFYSDNSFETFSPATPTV